MALPYSFRPIGTVHAFTMSSSSQATAAFAAGTFAVRLATGAQPAFWELGDGTPTATAADNLMGANQTEYITVTPGQKIAVLEAGTAGLFSVTECR